MFWRERKRIKKIRNGELGAAEFHDGKLTLTFSDGKQEVVPRRKIHRYMILEVFRVMERAEIEEMLK